MTEILQQAFEKASLLPPEQQASLAEAILRCTDAEEGLVAYTQSELEAQCGLTAEARGALQRQIAHDED